MLRRAGLERRSRLPDRTTRGAEPLGDPGYRTNSHPCGQAPPRIGPEPSEILSNASLAAATSWIAMPTES